MTRRRPPTRLAALDFDWTLFRSPEVPWLYDDVSLSPPFVPRKPGSEWWIGPSVTAARAAVGDPATRTALMTGRAPSFAERVGELLGGVWLHFDEHHFTPCGLDPLAFKLATLESMVRAHPTVVRVAMWEDVPAHAEAFEAKLAELGVAGDVVLVTDVRRCR